MTVIRDGLFEASAPGATEVDLDGIGGTRFEAATPARVEVAAGETAVAGPGGAAGARIDTSSIPLGSGVVAATPPDTWFFQAWYREGPESRPTNAVSVAF